MTTANLSKQLIKCLSRKPRARETVSKEDLFNKVLLLLQQGADPNYNCRGTIPLCEASRLGRVDIVEILLIHGANVNSYDKNQCSPLYLAASHGHMDVTKMLMSDYDADINTRTMHGYFPLLSAVENSHMDVARLLIDAGAEVNISRPNTFGVQMSLLTFVLFAKSDFSFAESLLQAGVNHYTFETPLNFILLEYGDECRNFVKKLVFAGFNFYCEDWIMSTRNKLRGELTQVSDSEKDMMEFLVYEHTHTPSLQRLCRTVVRTRLSRSKVKLHMRLKIEQLPLPREVQKFLSLDYLE